jgi:serine/threonine-protein kinase RIO1
VRSVPGSVSGEGSARFEKFFHHPTLLGRLRDSLRARREARILRHLKRAGVRVPRVLGVERRDGAWVVAMERIEGARDLARYLMEKPNPASLARLARDLGIQVARLHGAGIDHRDLHAGNVLIDEHGRVWLIDFHSAYRRRLGRPPLERDLLRAEAFLRERMSPRLRLRALLAHQREPGGWRADRQKLRALSRDLAAKGSAARHKDILRAGGRWLRESGVVGLTPTEQGDALLNREFDAAKEAESGPDRVLLRGEPKDLERVWRLTAIAHEHALPTLIPWQLRLTGTDPYVLLRWPDQGATDTAELKDQLLDRGLREEDYDIRGAAGGGEVLTPRGLI